MSQPIDAVWLNVSSTLRGFDRPLLKHLSSHYALAQWEYVQSLDEPLSLDGALTLLHDYLKSCDRPVHLAGHSTGGLLGLLYARHYPARVRSLSLLSVGANPAIDWQAYYYSQLQQFRCSRDELLTQMVYLLFGYQPAPIVRELRQILDRDLQSSLSPHTLCQPFNVFPGGVSVPLLVCGSHTDQVISHHALEAWQPWLTERDRLWLCPNGRYFFHYFQPRSVSYQIAQFWLAQDVHEIRKHWEVNTNAISYHPHQIEA